MRRGGNLEPVHESGRPLGLPSPLVSNPPRLKHRGSNSPPLELTAARTQPSVTRTLCGLNTTPTLPAALTSAHPTATLPAARASALAAARASALATATLATTTIATALTSAAFPTSAALTPAVIAAAFSLVVRGSHFGSHFLVFVRSIVISGANPGFTFRCACCCALFCVRERFVSSDLGPAVNLCRV